MPATQAKGAFGTKLQRGDGATPTETFTTIAEVGDITGPNLTQVIEDATNQDSPDGWAEKIAVGVREAGDVTCQVHLLQDDATQNLLLSDLNASTKRNYRIVYPSGTKRLSFAAFVASLGSSYPVRGKMVRDLTLSITGKVTQENHP